MRASSSASRTSTGGAARLNECCRTALRYDLRFAVGRAVAWFDWDVVARQHLEFFDEILAGREAARPDEHRSRRTLPRLPEEGWPSMDRVAAELVQPRSLWRDHAGSSYRRRSSFRFVRRADRRRRRCLVQRRSRPQPPVGLSAPRGAIHDRLRCVPRHRSQLFTARPSAAAGSHGRDLPRSRYVSLGLEAGATSRDLRGSRR